MDHHSKHHWTFHLCAACSLALATAGAAALPQSSMQDADKAEAPIRYQRYVSQSMDDASMKTALAQASVQQDMVLVFRGLKRGQTFADLMALTRGVANPRWIEDQVSAGRSGDLGPQGANRWPTTGISARSPHPKQAGTWKWGYF